jgi:hypothetical protein
MKKMLIGISFAALSSAILMSESHSASAVEMPASCNIGFAYLKECCTISFRRRPMRTVDSSERQTEIMTCIGRMKADAGKRQNRSK